MQAAQTHPHEKPGPQGGKARSWLTRLGANILGFFCQISLTVAVALAAGWHMMQPRTWRRTVRQEFVRQCWQAGIKALPTTILTGLIVGVALLFQAVLSFEFLGGVLSILRVGSLVILNLVREIAPLLVALIVIGRSGTVMVVELVEMQTSGQIRTLESHGIDAFDYLIVPRIAALAVCMFSLAVISVLVALVAGQVLASAFGVVEYSLLEFLREIAQFLTKTEYMLLPIKTIALGFTIGAVLCVTALHASTDQPLAVRELLPLGFMRAVVAALLVSGTLTIAMTTIT